LILFNTIGTLNQIGKEYEFPIKDQSAAVTFLNDMIQKTNGMVNVGFISSGFWDHLEKVIYHATSSLTELIFHDFRGIQRSSDELETTVFSESLYSELFHFESVERFIDQKKGKKITIFTIAGNAVTDDDLKKHFNDNSLFDSIWESKYSDLVIRDNQGVKEIYHTLTDDVRFAAIYPKGIKFDSLQFIQDYA